MNSSPPSKKLKLVISVGEEKKNKDEIFKGFYICLVEPGLGKVRHNVFEKQLKKHGGIVTNHLTDNTTHVLIANNVNKNKLKKFLKVDTFEKHLEFVKVNWISECLVKGELLDTKQYLAFNDSINTVAMEDTIEKNLKEENKINIQTSKYQEVSLDSNLSYIGSKQDNHVQLTSKAQPHISFTFTKALPSQETNYNEHITEKLAILQKNYTTTQDKWRAFGYKKAIKAIENYHKPLETYEEVLKLPYVGERLAQKIWEIVETGHLRRLDHVDPKVELLNLFSAVWGAGPKTAETWIAKGYQTLDDVRNHAELTSQQKIGLKHYKDINEKMNRKEVAEIENLIRSTAESLLKGVTLTICGSYRRGREFCGDIDVLVSHPDGHSHKGFLKVLLDQLKKESFITDDLIKVDNEEQRKYMGICKLPGPNRKFRRIDFIVAPYNEWPLALVHFTGSAHLNRSMRLCAKKKNMSLSEHSLRKNVVYGADDDKLHDGEVIPIFHEKDVFNHLGLDYLEPTDRDW